MPKISVIVPVYRVEPYLRRCLDSIIVQSFSNFDLILVDDGSPDNCGAICEDYARRDERVHVIHQKNGGLSAARNAGIDWAWAHSDSQWLSFVDSDDWVHPEMLERMYRAALEKETKIAVCGYTQTEGENPVIFPEQFNCELWCPKDFYMQRHINATICCGKLYHRSCFDGERYPVGKHMEDEFLTYRLLFAQEALTVIPAPLYAYYFNPTGITKSAWTPKRLDAWEAYEQQIAFFEQRGEWDLVRFRYRGYLENAVVNEADARQAQDSPEVLAARKRIHATIKNLLKRMSRLHYLEFWPDSELLLRYFPVRARICRLYLETRARLEREKNA